MPAPRTPPVSPDVAVTQRADALCEMGRPEKAIEMLKPALATWPESYDLHIAFGWACGQFECLDDAEAAYRRAITLRPDRAHAYNVLSRLLIRMYRSPEALECARASIRLAPNQAAAYIAAADAARLSGDAPAALDYARESVRLSGQGEWRIGRVLLSYEHWGEAENILRRTQATHPMTSDTPMFLALALIPQGRLEEADYSLRDALRIWPRYTLAELILQRVRTWLLQERTLRQSLKAKPSDAPTLANLGSMLLAQGRLDEAIDALQVAAQPLCLPAHVDQALCVALEHQAALARGEVPGSPMLALELEMWGVIDQRRRRRGKRA